MSLEHSPARHGSGAVAATAADDTFMPQRAVSEMLGVSERSLERWRLQGGQIPFRKFGRRVLYSRADVLAWADSQRRTSTSDDGKSA